MNWAWLVNHTRAKAFFLRSRGLAAVASADPLTLEPGARLRGGTHQPTWRTRARYPCSGAARYHERNPPTRGPCGAPADEDSCPVTTIAPAAGAPDAPMPATTLQARLQAWAVARWPSRAEALWTMVVTAIVVLVTRIPFLTTEPFNWDSAQFILAMRDYDVTRFQPHPPGYAVYVFLGNVFNTVIPDPHTALLVLSVLFSILATWSVFFLATRLGGLLAGWIAAAMLMGSVTYWAYGGVALTYVSLTFWATTVAALAYGIRYDRKTWLPLMAVIWAVACGFRGELVVFLFPVAVWAAWGQPWRRIALSVAIFGITASLWFVPMVLLSGGLFAYLDVFQQYVARDVVGLYSVACDTCEQAGVDWGASGGLLSNLYDVMIFNYYALGNGLVLFPVVLGTIWWIGWGWRLRRQALILALVTLFPALLFYNLVHIGDQGYIFSTYGLLLALTAVALAGIAGAVPWRTGVILGLLAIGLAINSWSFLGWDTTVSRIGLERHDLTIRSQLDRMAQTPQDQRLALGADHYRHILVEFPTMRTVREGDAQVLWSDRYNPVGIAVDPKPFDRTLYVIDEDLIRLVPAAGGRIEDLPAGRIGIIQIPAGQRLQYGANNSFIEVVTPD